jgi:hypothetical protein
MSPISMEQTWNSDDDALALRRRRFEGEPAVEVGDLGLVVSRIAWIASGALKLTSRVGPEFPALTRRR